MKIDIPVGLGLAPADKCTKQKEQARKLCLLFELCGY